MKKAIKVLLVLLLFCAVGLGLFLVYKYFISDFLKNDSKPEVIEEAKKLDYIKGFDYELYDSSTELYQILYYELKDTLEADTIDYEKYAETISKMFVVDFYTLNNKVTNQDVGGLEFIYSNNKDNFSLKASDTMYKYIESNVYGDREQKLPEVSEILTSEVSVNAYKYTDEDSKFTISDDNGYIVKLTWSYKEDLGYQKSATIRLVHEDKVLSIVSVE